VSTQAYTNHEGQTRDTSQDLIHSLTHTQKQ